MASRGPAGDADAVGIDVVLLGVGPQPANRRFHVMNRRRELVFRSEPITDCCCNIALLGKPKSESIVTLAGACPESAAMNADNRGERTLAAFGPGQVQLKMLPIGVRVFDVRLERDIAGQLYFAPCFLGRGYAEEECTSRQHGNRESKASESWLHGCLESCSG